MGGGGGGEKKAAPYVNILALLYLGWKWGGKELLKIIARYCITYNYTAITLSKLITFIYL